MFTRSKSRVLLIEDNPQDADLIKHALLKTDADLFFETVRNGEAALGFLKTWENGAPIPTIVLLDLELPGISGFEVLINFKQHPRFTRIPVIVLTGSEDPKNIMRANTLGANSIITKPVDFDKFSQTVTQIYHYWCILNTYPEKI